MKIKDNIVIFTATGCYIGKIPFAPGTFGSLLGLPICYLLSCTSSFYSFLFILAFVLLLIRIAGKAEEIIGKKDAPEIVIDEIAGMMITLFGLSFNFFVVFLGFILFRLLDILKPFPISYVEKKLSGGTAIMLDDVVTGIIANIILRLVFI